MTDTLLVVSVPRTQAVIERIAATSPARWLIFAAAFHLTITLCVFLIGHFGWLPNLFNENGIALTLAPDGVFYQRLIAEMAEALKHGDFSLWSGTQAPLHARLYSLTFVFPGTLVGNNILAAETFNLVYYLGVLVCTYTLGKQIFDQCTGLAAAALVAVWPSFVVHSTQLIRDSLAIFCIVALVIILVRVIDTSLSWRSCLITSLGSIALIISFWLTRGNMWNIVFVALAITAILLAVKIVREKKILFANVALFGVIVAAVLVIPSKIESTTTPGYRPPVALITISSNRTSSRSFPDRLLTQINVRRQGFKGYIGKSSNIDSDVTFTTFGEVLRYLPRAAEIGLFAPFPRMWFEAGSGGRAARLLAGCETGAIYLLYLPVMFCVWNNRRDLQAWLIFLFATASMITLGLVVTNVGALYRLRFVFWILVVLLAVEGSKRIADFRFKIAD